MKPEAARALPVADYLSEKIWSTMGMESDATWWLESPAGLVPYVFLQALSDFFE